MTPTVDVFGGAALVAPTRTATGGLAAGALVDPGALANRLSLELRQARYAPVIEGHYGLNVAVYTHLTSPLRRFADLVIRRYIIQL